jgi:hypothetical protein
MSYECGIGGRAASSMRISILAWGSLVWDRKDLAVVADFAPSGPWLPVEFCRVSRDRRLTLVIDEAFGATCITHSALSTFDNLEAAIENLRIRECMPSRKGVGFAIADKAQLRSNAIREQLKPLPSGLVRKALTPQSGLHSQATLRRRHTSHSRSKLRSDTSKRAMRRH